MRGYSRPIAAEFVLLSVFHCISECNLPLRIGIDDSECKVTVYGQWSGMEKTVLLRLGCLTSASLLLVHLNSVHHTVDQPVLGGDNWNTSSRY